MSTFVKGGVIRTPFGRNEYLRSTNPKPLTDSYTLAAASIAGKTIDGFTNQKILQPGTVLAKITSGSDIGKVGPYQASGTAEVQTITKIAGTISGGTYALGFNGSTTTALAFDATAATVQAALNLLPTVIAAAGQFAVAGTEGVVVTGGPIGTTPQVVTFNGGGNQPMITFDATLLTGTTPGATVAETTPGVAGATDGRQTAANIVGLNDTFLPWQLIERDVEIAAVYGCVAVQAWCIELNAAGVSIPLSNTTADAMRGTKTLQILFK